ncbi:MAG: hypothetical protein ACOWYE_07095 [Desulfatiglandales bacterium]
MRGFGKKIKEDLTGRKDDVKKFAGTWEPREVRRAGMSFLLTLEGKSSIVQAKMERDTAAYMKWACPGLQLPLPTTGPHERED